MMGTSQLKWTCLFLVAIVALSGCFGGSGDTPRPDEPLTSFEPAAQPTSSPDSPFVPPVMQTDLQVGFWVSDVTPPVGVPLGGFGLPERRIFPFDVFNKYPFAHYLKPSEGTLDPIRSKVMLLKRGSSRLIFVSLDVVGITRDVRADLMELLKPMNIADNELFFSATHTHSGPAGLSRNPLFQMIAMDRFVPEVYEQMLKGIADSVQKADLAAVPAELYATSFKAEGLQENRRGYAGHVDNTANILLARGQSGKWIGAMINLAIHGTSIGPDSLQYSADVPGGMERAFESALKDDNLQGDGAIPVLFVNGAEGDVAPKGEGLIAMNEVATSFGIQASTALIHARKIDSNWKVQSAVVDLGNPKFNLRGCMGQNSVWQKLIFKKLKPSLRRFMARTATIWHIRLGDMNLMTWPGEPVTTLGLALKTIAARDGINQTWVLGLTNDHLAYFTTEVEYEEGGNESCNSFYGHEAGDLILGAYLDLLSN